MFLSDSLNAPHHNCSTHSLESLTGCILEAPITLSIASSMRAAASGTILAVAVVVAEIAALISVTNVQGNFCTRSMTFTAFIRRQVAELVIGMPIAVGSSLALAYVAGTTLAFGKACLVTLVSFVAARILFLLVDVVATVLQASKNYILSGRFHV